MWEAVSGLGAIAAAIVAIGSVIVAIRARKDAQAANEHADEANKLAAKANEFAENANRIAAETLADAQHSRVDASWTRLIEATHRLVGADLFGQDLRGPLVELRTSETLLVDDLQWEGFGDWVAQEHVLGAAIANEIFARGQPGLDETPDQLIARFSRYHAWAAAFQNNLRLFRKRGPDRARFDALTRHAQEIRRGIYEQNGWGSPSDEIPGLVPIDDHEPGMH